MHLEGPYLAVTQKGAMDAKYIRSPIPAEYEEICGLSDNIRRITIAPELPGAVELGNYLYSRGILPSVGHTDAVCADVIAAYENGGYKLMTHLYSAMSQTRRIGINRYAGAVEAAYLIDGMSVEIIADGIHLPKELLKLVYQIKGSDRTALITDAMRGSGMSEGLSVIGSRKNGQQVIIEDGVAKLPDKTAFAGSIATADRLIRTMTGIAGVTLVEAVKMATVTPAKIMNIYDDRGSLEVGKYADLVVFDDDIDVKLTMVEGEIVFSVISADSV
jgi:N-acetylglucosamine-6-phosphate deacetylase